MQDEENPKYIQIVTTASSLFMRHGIRRISVEEICREAGVSKMTYYKYFKNKNELVHFILDQIAKKALKQYKGIMAQDVPYRKKVEQLIQMKLDMAERMTPEFLKDFMHNPDPEIARWYEELMQIRMKLLLENFIQAQKDGDVRGDYKPEFIMYMLYRMTEMVDDERLTGLYGSTKELTEELTKFFFYGILASDENE
jgi:AcrR family transcriptional regulator